jgi:hypothetical protein
MVPPVRSSLRRGGRRRALQGGDTSRMNIVELVVAGALALGGLRSLWTWSRRRFEGAHVADHVLYALYVTGRVGLWFAFAGLFLIYSLTSVDGKPTSELARFRWYFMVPIGLAVLQLLAGFALGRRGSN